MRKNFIQPCVIIWLAVCSVLTGYSQSDSFQQVEQKVYRLNNELKYKESQALLLPALQDEQFSAQDKYQAAILLSYTYKRVFDYQSTLKYLKMAREFAEKTANKRQNIANIQAEEAFILFDRHDYQKADSLMNFLAKSDFTYINLENKSKLVMQQGYLQFLEKQYAQAEATYDRAIDLMRLSASCHLPMIFVKKMQLYNAMNRIDKMSGALQQSIYYADSCKIIKYQLYAYEELRDIYKGRNNLHQLTETQKKLDSLNLVYAREENISALHNQKENILLKANDQKLHQEQLSKGYLTFLLAGLGVVAMALVGWLLAYRRRQRQLEAEHHRMKAELETYISQNGSVLANRNSSEKEHLNGLSERQREVLDYMALGMSNKAIADKLFISENTVKYHIKNIYQLLDIKDRKEFLVSVKK